MLVNINAASAGRQSALGELGELSRARVILSEFKYNRGTEIYGEAEPADYIYQVVEGLGSRHKCNTC
jgi:CRP/FNR family nitrogen fixation transcriptional regulator